MQVGPRTGTGTVTYSDTQVAAGNAYQYQVFAVNAAGPSSPPTTSAVVNILAPPPAPTDVNAAASIQGNNARITLTWTDVATETGYRIQRATDPAFTANVVTSTVAANVTTFGTGNVSRRTPFYLRVQAYNGAGASAWVNATPFPIVTP